MHQKLMTSNKVLRFNQRELEICGERIGRVRNLLTVLGLVGVTFTYTGKILYATWASCESDATYDKVLDGIKDDSVYCNVFRGVSYIVGDKLMDKLNAKYGDGIITTVFFGGDMLIVTKKEISLDLQSDVNYELQIGPQFSCRINVVVGKDDFYDEDESVEIRKIASRYMDSIFRS